MLTYTSWRYISGGLAGVATLVALLFLQQHPRPLPTILTIFFWLAAMQAIFSLVKKHTRVTYSLHILSFFLGLGIVGLLFVLELPVLRKGIITLAVGTFALLYGWTVRDDGLWESMKPVRRFVMMNWVFAAYAWLTTLFALSAFFQGRLFNVVTAVVGAAMLAVVSLEIWRLYFKSSLKPLILWALLIGLVFVEVIWAVSLLPFAYAVLGLLVCWMWYILQLLARFHFSARGIVWKKQMSFLITNSILFILLLVFFVRWV